MLKIDVATAVETFVLGHTKSKSLTHPYEFLKIGPVWGMRDANRKNPRLYRKEEWVGYQVAPEVLAGTVAQHTRGWHFLAILLENDDDANFVRDQYKRLGYRLLSTEPLFVHSLQRIPRKTSPAKVVRMTHESQRLAYAQAARMAPLPVEVMADDSPWRHYLAMVGPRVVGWVSSIQTSTGATWCTNMVVRQEFRRQGIGSSLLEKMLRDDRIHSAQASVLLSSHTGAWVYPTLGYTLAGILLLMAPAKR